MKNKLWLWENSVKGLQWLSLSLDLNPQRLEAVIAAKDALTKYQVKVWIHAFALSRWSVVCRLEKYELESEKSVLKTWKGLKMFHMHCIFSKTSYSRNFCYLLRVWCMLPCLISRYKHTCICHSLKCFVLLLSLSATISWQGALKNLIILCTHVHTSHVCT